MCPLSARSVKRRVVSEVLLLPAGGREISGVGRERELVGKLISWFVFSAHHQG